MPGLVMISRRWESMALMWNELIKEKCVLVGDLSEADKVYQFVKFANKAGQYLLEAKKYK